MRKDESLGIVIGIPLFGALAVAVFYLYAWMLSPLLSMVGIIG